MYRLNSYMGMAENDYLYAKAGMDICQRVHPNHGGHTQNCCRRTGR